MRELYRNSLRTGRTHQLAPRSREHRRTQAMLRAWLAAHTCDTLERILISRTTINFVRLQRYEILRSGGLRSE